MKLKRRRPFKSALFDGLKRAFFSETAITDRDLNEK
jgi:hypothetical protein